MAPKIQVETRQYEFSQGKKPRGYGFWFFGARVGERTVQHGITGFYSAAKTQASAAFQRDFPNETVVRVEVLP